MKVVSTEALTKLIQLVKSAFISVNDTVETSEVTLATVATTGDYDDLSGTPSLATVATSGDYDDLINKPTIPTVNNSTITLTQGGVTKGSFTLNQSSDDTIDFDAGGGSSRNVGEIVASTIPLSDAGLHLLDGSVLQGGGIYDDFVTYIAGLVSTYPDCFTTEANWQQSVTNYGVCGKFVYNSVKNTVRLPKITGIVEGTTDLTALGDLVEAGAPNITGMIPVGRGMIVPPTPTGAFTKRSTTYDARVGGGDHDDWGNYYDFSASNSDSIYGNSTTVQPQTIKVLYYIVIATATKTDIKVDIDEIATDLNGKADVDLSNVISGAFENVVATAQASGKRTVRRWGIPDYSAGVSVNGKAGYTATADGIVFLFLDTAENDDWTYVYCNGHSVAMAHGKRGRSNGDGTAVVPVKAGDVITAGSNFNSASGYFYPFI